VKNTPLTDSFLNHMEQFNYFLKKLQFYASILLHRETPLLVKILLGCGLLYIVFPMDFIPDQIPLLGILDDISIASAIIYFALRMVPEHIFDSLHKKYFTETTKEE
jgi:uncharacterized membrane protein YkvA (DUF1232 family)